MFRSCATVILATAALVGLSSTADAQVGYYTPGYGSPLVGQYWNQSTYNAPGAVYTLPSYSYSVPGYVGGYYGYGYPYYGGSYYGTPGYGFGVRAYGYRTGFRGYNYGGYWGW